MGVRPEKLPSALEGVFLMGRKPKYSIEEKIKAVEDVLIRKKSKNSVAKGLGTSLGVNELNYWIAQYKADGPDGLRTHQRNNQYTEEDRMMVFEYIRAGKSVSEVSRMLLIPATVIRNWVKCYNNPTKVVLLSSAVPCQCRIGAANAELMNKVAMDAGICHARNGDLVTYYGIMFFQIRMMFLPLTYRTGILVVFLHCPSVHPILG